MAIQLYILSGLTSGGYPSQCPGGSDIEDTYSFTLYNDSGQVTNAPIQISIDISGDSVFNGGFVNPYVIASPIILVGNNNTTATFFTYYETDGSPACPCPCSTLFTVTNIYLTTSDPNYVITFVSAPPSPTQTPTQTPSPTQTQTPTPTPSTTPIICGSGTTTGTYYYTDCCGNFIQGTTVGLVVSIDYTKPYNGVVKLNVPATTVCASPTPTPTQTLTPTNTITPTITPTSTLTPTPTPTVTLTPSNSPVFRPKNECDVVTLFDMGIQCYPLAIPTSSTSNDGVLSILVTGGTSPYSYYWADGQRTQTLVGVSQKNYEVTVVDFYGDYTATTVCSLFPVSPTPTSTVTPTPTTTPAPVYPNLCLIYVGQSVSYGPIHFVINGTVNGKPTWTATYNQTQLNVEWSIQNSRWEIQGWTFTIGIPVSVNTSNVPDSGWSIAGGTQAQLSMTQGNCPDYLPLQSVPTSQKTTCPAVNNGSITLVTNYGVQPYQYSINNGQTYQQSNVFQGLSPSTYTVITKDSANNTLSNTVVITSLGQNANYTIGVVVDNIVNLSSGSQMANWRVNITPPLPFGTSISFQLPVNTIKGYYAPGTGTINATTVVKKNNATIGIAGQSSTPLVTAPRAFCSPNTSGETTTTTLYTVNMGYGDVVSGYSISDLVITNGQVASNSCVTKLEQSILINTTSAVIAGGACNSVANNPQPQGITNHSISNTNSNPIVPLTITNTKINTCTKTSASILKNSVMIYSFGVGAAVGTTVAVFDGTSGIDVRVGDILTFEFTAVPTTPACVGVGAECSDLFFTLQRNGVNVTTDDITSCVVSNNTLTYTYTIPAGSTSLSVQILSEVS